MESKRLRVLVVDDSAYTRRSISGALASHPNITIAAKAADGEEALSLIRLAHPDVITLDLEMPRMDGFAFLRILMATRPLPVIVVSSYGQRENVFRALELGALDFVVKPDRVADAALAGIQDELVEKVLLARRARQRQPRAPQDLGVPVRKGRWAGERGCRRLIGIVSSTGGPTALLELASDLPAGYGNAVVVAQHMPPQFTRTFAERLNSRSQLEVSEASHGSSVSAGQMLVCPGRRNMLVEGHWSRLSVRIEPTQPGDRYTPSGDRLLRSVAEVAGSKSVAVILTGMGDDGVAGARSIKEAGGTVIAESEASAVVYGMPGAAMRAGIVDESLPLAAIARRLAEWDT